MGKSWDGAGKGPRNCEKWPKKFKLPPNLGGLGWRFPPKKISWEIGFGNFGALGLVGVRGREEKREKKEKNEERKEENERKTGGNERKMDGKERKRRKYSGKGEEKGKWGKRRRKNLFLWR